MRLFLIICIVLGAATYIGGARAATITGTGGPDNLIGTNSADLMYGFGGGDTILGKGGDDEQYGGSGGDLIGSDGGINGYMSGGAGPDLLDGVTHNCNFYPRSYIGGDGEDTAIMWAQTFGGSNVVKGIEHVLYASTESCKV